MNEILNQKIKVLPTSSGVYVMKDEAGNVIYVGKAKNLKNRVSGYFQNSVKHEKVRQMVGNIFDMEYFVVPSEYDAFVLERNLIAKHQPFYNILLKDGKQYPYLKLDLTKSFPKLEVTRRVRNDKAKYFGPYLFPIRAEELIKIVNYAFPLRTCTTKINKNKFLERPCLNYDLGLCSAPCAGKITKENYQKIVKQVINFLNGDSKEIEQVLLEKMKIAAEAENFETAIELKNKIAMVKKLDSKVITQLTKTSNYDCVGVSSDGVFVSTCIMQIRGGKLLNVECFNLINISGNLEDIVSNFICDYYSQQVIPAQEILVGMKLDNSFLESYLLNLKQTKVNFVYPQKGIKKKLVEMSNANATNYVERSIEKSTKIEQRTLGALQRLKNELSLKSLPERIECYDISHLGGTEKVGSMVVFVGGQKMPKLYRKFKITSVEGIDDFASLCEVLQRRIEEYKKQKDVSFSQKPNLIVIDGGKGQLSKTHQIVLENKFNVEMISLAKKFEEVFTPVSNIPTMLKRGSVELMLLQNLRDEAHRFAITFNRQKRLKKPFVSPLTEVEGIGEKTAQNLMKAFGTINNLKVASRTDLLKIKGVSLKNIEKLINYLKKS